MIVSEGPDGGGKSTAARLISERLGWRIAPRVVSQQATAMTDLRAWADGNIAKGFHHTIYDRHRLISDPIYRACLTGAQHNPELYQIDWLSRAWERFVYHCHPILIFSIPPLEVVMHNITHGVDDNSVIHPDAEKIYHSYVAMFSIMRVLFRDNVYLHDYTTDHDGERLLEWTTNRVLFQPKR